MSCSCEIASMNSSVTASAQGNEVANEMRGGRGCDKWAAFNSWLGEETRNGAMTLSVFLVKNNKTLGLELKTWDCLTVLCFVASDVDSNEMWQCVIIIPSASARGHKNVCSHLYSFIYRIMPLYDFTSDTVAVHQKWQISNCLLQCIIIKTNNKKNNFSTILPWVGAEQQQVLKCFM